MNGTSEFHVIEPCTSVSGIEIKLKKKIDLKKAENVFSKHGEVAGSSPVVLLVGYKGYSISIYESGRMMVKGNGVNLKKGEGLAKELIPLLKKEGAI